MTMRIGGRILRPLHAWPIIRPCRLILLAFAASTSLLSSFAAVAGIDAEGCTDLDSIPVGQVGAFEKSILSNLRSNNADLLSAIAREKALSDDLRSQLKSALDSIKKNFAG